MNYKEADAKLTGRNRESRRIANNTYLKRRDQSHKHWMYWRAFLRSLRNETTIEAEYEAIETERESKFE